MLTAAFAAISATAGAWGQPLPEKGQTLTQTFMGTEASSNPENPCKGKTTRVCGKIVISNNDGMLTQTNKDAFGFVLYQWNGSEDEWMAEHIYTGDDDDDNEGPLVPGLDGDEDIIIVGGLPNN